MESLGYSQNQGAFLDLAYLVPYTSLGLNAEASPSHTTAQRIAKTLLKTAGFLSDEDALSGGPPTMPQGRWHLFRLRPSNHPRRRIQGMALLLALHQENGLIQGLASLARQTSGTEMEKALTVEDPGGGAALIGRDRAGDMAVNVVLPFLHAWSFPRGDSQLGVQTLSLYQGFRKLQENLLTREMEESLFPRTWLPLARGACHQQGLIHLHHLAAGEG